MSVLQEPILASACDGVSGSAFLQHSSDNYHIVKRCPYCASSTVASLNEKNKFRCLSCFKEFEVNILE